jgi:hypothetical protein
LFLESQGWIKILQLDSSVDSSSDTGYIVPMLLKSTPISKIKGVGIGEAIGL